MRKLPHKSRKRNVLNPEALGPDLRVVDHDALPEPAERVARGVLRVEERE